MLVNVYVIAMVWRWLCHSNGSNPIYADFTLSTGYESITELSVLPTESHSSKTQPLYCFQYRNRRVWARPREENEDAFGRADSRFDVASGLHPLQRPSIIEYFRPTGCSLRHYLRIDTLSGLKAGSLVL